MTEKKRFIVDDGTGHPKMPNYLYKKKDWNIVQIDKSRFRKVNEDYNSFNLPCSDYTIKVPKQLRIKDIRQVTIQKYFGKIKINIKLFEPKFGIIIAPYF